MRRFAFFTLAIGVVVACNAISGAGDLTVCEGAQCAPGTTPVVTNEAGGTSGTATGGTSGEAGPGPNDGGSTDGNVCGTCPEACVNNACVSFPSCAAGLQCGSPATSCCQTLGVPGGTFNRFNKIEAPATVSSFSLDRYEVTVGRYRAFIASGTGTASSPPAPGSGAHPKIADSGWRADWNSRLPNDTNLLKSDLVANGTMTPDPDKYENFPITGVTWFEAFAFCAWDGGRLPTAAEWDIARAAGTEQRFYPWSSSMSDTTLDKNHATYACLYADPGYTCPPASCQGAANPPGGACVDATCADAGGTCQTPACYGCDRDKDMVPVGSLAAGAGKYGHLDLVGNAAEILLDARPKKAGFDLLTPCTDCAPVMGPNPHQSGPGGGNDYQYIVAGGDWGDEESALYPGSYFILNYDERYDGIGFRCARDR